jgi:hypothetical protein
LTLSFSPVPAVSLLYLESKENQSQKFALSLSVTGSALVSEQLPLAPGRKNRQFRQERRSFPQVPQQRERLKGSGSETGTPQYQHILYCNRVRASWQVTKMVK